MDTNERYMRRCLQLARQGATGAPPNPMVGCVIVCHDRIIGEGFHARCGEGHAEVNALASVSRSDRALLPEATLYVSLEPCAHYGRTPPCAERIVREGIRRVVVGCVDSFARVSGRGIALLREAGVKVEVGFLEDECRQLNAPFFTVQEQHRPWITLKWAASADGCIDAVRTGGQPARLSTPHTLLRVHRLRTLRQAILVGHRTLLLDRPRLDVRHWCGPAPLRCVLGRVPSEELPEGFVPFTDIDSCLRSLMERGVQSLLVEGGKTTLQSFIDRDLWDEAWEEESAVRLLSPQHEGIAAPVIAGRHLCATEWHFGVPFRHWRRRP